jgi:hypothetical protein
MTYIRVLPRDAFNESKLLKCVGRLVLLIEDRKAPGWSYDFDGEPFQIEQDQNDGSIYVRNIQFIRNGDPVALSSGLNSRAPWPLRDENGDSIFDDDGNLTGGPT